MRPKLLLVEDDPVSAAFIVDALAGVVDLEHVANAEAALARAATRRFDMLLIDRNLPDSTGPELLAQLRASPAAACVETPALLLSADLSDTEIGDLTNHGFHGALQKPIGASALCAAVQNALASTGTGKPAWDDAAALIATGGKPNIVAALRALLLGDLREQIATIAGLIENNEIAAADSILHRLLAACGFCGAKQLAAQVRILRERLSQGSDVASALAAARHAAERLYV